MLTKKQSPKNAQATSFNYSNNENNLINFDFLADFGLINEEDLKIFKYADTASEAWETVSYTHLTLPTTTPV